MNWPFSTDSAHLLLSIGSCLVSTGPVLWSPFAAGSVGCLDMRRDEHEGAWFMELEESIDSVSFAIYHHPVESLLGMLHGRCSVGENYWCWAPSGCQLQACGLQLVIIDGRCVTAMLELPMSPKPTVAKTPEWTPCIHVFLFARCYFYRLKISL